MSASEDEFLQRLRSTFRVEAAEHLHTISAGLLELEHQSDPIPRQQLIESVYRAAHSLKGAARAVDLSDIESLCKSLEGVFAAWKRAESRPDGLLDRAKREMLVELRSELHVLVAELLGYQCHRHTLHSEAARIGVAQRLKRDRWHNARGRAGFA